MITGLPFCSLRSEADGFWGFAVFDNGPQAALSAKRGLSKAPKA